MHVIFNNCREDSSLNAEGFCPNRNVTKLRRLTEGGAVAWRSRFVIAVEVAALRKRRQSWFLDRGGEDEMMYVDPNKVSATELADALREIQPTLTPRQLAALEVLYRAKGHSIPDDGSGKFSEFVLTFGKVGGKISRLLGKMPQTKYHLMWLSFQVIRKGVSYWRMRDNVVEALTDLGWFEKSPLELMTERPRGSRNTRLVKVATQVLASLSPQRRSVIETIYQAQEHELSGVEIAARLNFKNRIVANAAVGSVGKRMFHAIGAHPEGHNEGSFEWWHVIATGRPDSARGFVWRLRSFVVEAIAGNRMERGADDGGLLREPPEGVVRPAARPIQSVEIERDEEVRHWVLMQAHGRCECCEQPAPFADSWGTAYLEVHHLRTLADQGSDRPANAVAVCPNCHRELHFGDRAGALKAGLYERLPRLVQE